jgi:uncharacterized membrane protein
MSNVQVPERTAEGRDAGPGRWGRSPARLEAVDLLRGVVMVLMALDHVRDAVSDARFNPLDLGHTDAALFLTRWVTHFCAPVFVFLAGTGAFLAGRRGKSRAQLAGFLLTRGLWLVVLELTLVRFGWYFNFDYHVLIAQVIWAIGWSMVALAGLVFLPTWAIAALGVVLVAGHNALDGVSADRLGLPPWLWVVLKSGGVVEVGWGSRLFVAYPVLPWLGVLLVGYGFGALWGLDHRRRRRLLTVLGLGLLGLFLALRSLNRYGDPRPWSEQATALFTLFSFVNCWKYPPSLLYVLMTLGPALLVLAWCDRSPGPVGRVLVTFGRVPLFFYLWHLPLIHVVAMGLAYARHEDVRFMFDNIFMAGQERLPPGYGYRLAGVYLVWLAVLALLYPPCRWFAGLKGRHRAGWLSYL